MAKTGKIIRNGITYSGGGGGCDIVYLTQAEYDALPDSKLTDGIEYRITDANTSTTVARNIAYDNSESGLEATSVQGAIDTMNERLAVYSTEEKVFGKDYDGKTIYEKTFVGTVSTKYNYTPLYQFYKTLATNVYRIVSCNGDIGASIGYWYSLNSTHYDGNFAVLLASQIRLSQDNIMELICETADDKTTSYEYRLVVRYTKVN